MSLDETGTDEENTLLNTSKECDEDSENNKRVRKNRDQIKEL